jgi:hypothetical protein
MLPSRHPSLKALPVALDNARGTIAITTLRNRTLSPLAELFHQDHPCGGEVTGQGEMIFGAHGRTIVVQPSSGVGPDLCECVRQFLQILLQSRSVV